MGTHPSTTTPREIVADATHRLAEAGVPEPEASAEILFSELLGIRRGEIPLYRALLTGDQSVKYEAMISRRLNREPVQRILGYAYFRNLKLKLNEATLIPRFDTESVVDLSLKVIDEGGIARILDMGTGTGAIAISISQERPACEVHASDISLQALEVARQNALDNGASVAFHHSDVASGLKNLGGAVELLVSNPPYIESRELSELEAEVRVHDPVLALDGGTDGLRFYRRILDESRPLLAEDARVVLEIGEGQDARVFELGEQFGFEPQGVGRDLTNRVRSVHLLWRGAES